jgi:chromosome segregation ATPase
MNASIEPMSEDLTRRLAKLTDESWAKDLEIQHLRNLHASEEAVSMRLKAELAMHQSKLQDAYERQNELEEMVSAKEGELQSFKEESKKLFKEANASHRTELDILQRTNASLRQRLDELQGAYNDKQAEVERTEAARAAKENELHHACQLVDSLRTAIEAKDQEVRTGREQVEQTQRAFQLRENQLNTELSRARAEQVRLEKSLQDANSAIQHLTGAIETLKSQHEAEMRELEAGAQTSLVELQKKLELEFQKQFEVVLSENQKFRKMLEHRDTQIEVDRQNLKQWQEQLNSFEMHLRQSKESLRRDRSELIRLMKQSMTELQMAREHSFREHVGVAEIEIARTQDQLANTSTLSPLRAKLEERLQQMIEQRNALKAGIDQIQNHIDERIQTLNNIVRNATVVL